MWMGMTSRSVNLATLKSILFVQIIPWFRDQLRLGPDRPAAAGAEPDERNFDFTDTTHDLVPVHQPGPDDSALPGQRCCVHPLVAKKVILPFSPAGRGTFLTDAANTGCYEMKGF